jgi:hypothetical protein
LLNRVSFETHLVSRSHMVIASSVNLVNPSYLRVELTCQTASAAGAFFGDNYLIGLKACEIIERRNVGAKWLARRVRQWE